MATDISTDKLGDEFMKCLFTTTVHIGMYLRTRQRSIDQDINRWILVWESIETSTDYWPMSRSMKYR